jgi:hypothetical protein
VVAVDEHDGRAGIIWTASALHAAVNFGQYPCAGYHPNRLLVGWHRARRSMRSWSAPRGRRRCSCATITSQAQAIVGISLLEILSSHSSNEVYLGQRDTPEWTSNAKAKEAFRRFGKRLEEIEAQGPRRPGQVPLYAALPQHLRPQGRQADATGITVPRGSQQHLHLINLWSPVNRGS